MAFRGAVQRGLADWRFTVGVVSGGHFLSHFYKLAFPPLFPLLRPEFGASNVQLGLLMTALWAGSFLQAPIGVLVDRVGGKRMFLGAVGLTSLGVVLSGLAVSYYVIFAFALLSGLGQAVFHPADYALLDAATEGDNEGKSFGVHTFGGYAGSAAAPVVVGGIGLAYGWREALVVTGAVGLVYVAFAAATMRPGATPAENESGESEGTETADGLSLDLRASLSGLFRPMILAVTGLFALLGMAGAGIQTFAPVLSVEAFGLDEGSANVTLTAFFAVAALGVLAGGVLADRYSPHGIIAASTVAAGLVTWGIVSDLVAVTPLVLVVLFAVVGLFHGLLSPARDRLVNALSTADTTGASFGLAFTGGSVGAAVSPIVVGAVIDAGYARLAFVLIGAFFLLGTLTVAALGVRTGWPTPRPAD